MLPNILKYTGQHLTTNNYLVQHVNSANVENPLPIKSLVIWYLPINPNEPLPFFSLTHSLTSLESCQPPFWFFCCQASSYLEGLGHYQCLKVFILSHLRWRKVHCGGYTSGMNRPGLRCGTGQLKRPSRIQDMLRHIKELEILPKDNRSQWSNISRERAWWNFYFSIIIMFLRVSIYWPYFNIHI